jgi:hypothetical protein
LNYVQQKAMTKEQENDWFMEALRIEEECGCDISAGYDFGTDIDKFYASTNSFVSLDKTTAILHEELSPVLSRQEIDSLVERFKDMANQLLEQKVNSQHSA